MSGQRWHKTVGFFVFRPPSHYIFAHSMYHPAVPARPNYTFCTQAEWLGGLTPMNDTPSSLTAASSELEIDLLKDLSRSQTIPMIYQMATNFYTQQLILNSHTDYTLLPSPQQSQDCPCQNLDLTKEQRTEVTAACKLIMWDPKRTDYDNDAIRLDVTAHLKKHQGSNGFKPIFDSKGQARIKASINSLASRLHTRKVFFAPIVTWEVRNTCHDEWDAKAGRLDREHHPVHAMRMVILQEASDLWIAEFDLSRECH
ncbi:hypothetical protein B0H10DRAFT_2231460 [Mycena sp. CBHHK59/15]|nr:hypothetical protein B0H10DRAFT_2231460 [Mycena sp. CBHHK59/15]